MIVGQEVTVWLDDATSAKPAVIQSIDTIRHSDFLISYGYPESYQRIWVRMVGSGIVAVVPTDKII